MAARSIRKVKGTRRVEIRLSLDVIQALEAMGTAKLENAFPNIDLSRSLPNMIALALDYAVWGHHDDELRERRRAVQVRESEHSARKRREVEQLERLYRLDGKGC